MVHENGGVPVTFVPEQAGESGPAGRRERVGTVENQIAGAIGAGFVAIFQLLHGIDADGPTASCFEFAAVADTEIEAPGVDFAEIDGGHVDIGDAAVGTAGDAVGKDGFEVDDGLLAEGVEFVSVVALGGEGLERQARDDGRLEGYAELVGLSVFGNDVGIAAAKDADLVAFAVLLRVADRDRAVTLEVFEFGEGRCPEAFTVAGV